MPQEFEGIGGHGQRREVVGSTVELIARISEAALVPRMWSSVLTELMNLSGAVGAAYIVRNHKADSILSADIVGAASASRDSYLEYYSRLDPYLPAILAGEGRWVSLAQLGRATPLAKSEWYNDFLGPLRIRDAAGIRLADTAAGSVVLGLHFESEVDAQPTNPILDLTSTLQQAAMLDLELRQRNLSTVAGRYALESASLGIAVINEAGKLLDTNAAADRILSDGGGLTVQNGRIHLLRTFEAARFEKCLALATANPHSGGRIHQMLVGRPGKLHPYVLRIIPLNDTMILSRHAQILVLISDPEDQMPTAADLGELFGLSPAESRVAAALVRGQCVGDIATDSGLAIATLRTQLRAIMKKVGVERQNQLIAALSTVGRGGSLDQLAARSDSGGEI